MVLGLWPSGGFGKAVFSNSDIFIKHFYYTGFESCALTNAAGTTEVTQSTKPAGDQRMKSRTKAVVIGGGIAGCSTLYHLTQEGWTDVVLVERDELTSGTTWHSAAQVTNFGMNQTMVGLKTHSINLYKELAEDPDYPINYHHADGGIRLANTQAQMEGYHHFASMARGMDVHFEVIDAEECARRHPLISTENLVGGLWDPLDGDIDPAQLCPGAGPSGAQSRCRGLPPHRCDRAEAARGRHLDRRNHQGQYRL